VGLGWGDEGKGKVVDVLCADHDVVVRYNGGANAGHTVHVDKEKFALHLLPAGVLHPKKHSVIGPGVVVDPAALLEEIDGLGRRGIEVAGNLAISDRAHVVMPYHKMEDQLSESAADEQGRIGTTARGIGPCYADKMRRTTAFRMGDLFRGARFGERLADVVRYKQAVFQAVYRDAPNLDAKAMAHELSAAAERIKPYVCDTTALLHERWAAGDRFLFEGANGTLLDVDHGTYPFVTSSSTTVGGVASGSGLPAGIVTNVLGVTKAYATRVGRGPFVTELNNELGEAIRGAGHEYGTTTGRPRRCGWFDAVAVGYSVRLNGATEIALMHLDTLSGFREIGLCTGYRIGKELLGTLPADAEMLDRAEPVVEMLEGWAEDVSRIDSFERLPESAQRYLARIEELVAAPITLIGVGPERSQIVLGNHDDAGRAWSSSTSV